MATQLTVLVADQAATVDDGDLVAANAAGNYAFVTAPHRTFIAFENGSGGPITVTIITKDESNHGLSADVAIVAPDTFTAIIAPFEEWQVNDAARIDLTYSAVGTCEVAVIQLGA